MKTIKKQTELQTFIKDIKKRQKQLMLSYQKEILNYKSKNLEKWTLIFTKDISTIL